MPKETTEAKQKLVSLYFSRPKNDCTEYHAELTNAGYDVSLRTVQRWVKELYENSFTERTEVAGVLSASELNKEPLPLGTYVITGAQCNTHVHEEFLASLLWYCKENSAKLIIPSIRYGVRSDNTVWYDPRIHEYLIDTPVELSPDLVLCSEVNVPITASRPLSGFASYVRQGSGIIPHTKMHMNSMPRLKGQDPRFLYSTGVCTLRNYPRTKVGRIADFHHMYSALVVSVTEIGWFVRQLVADDSGEFYDLEHHYTPTGRSLATVSSITFGDLHVESLSSTMLYTMTEILQELQPATVFCHDVLDFGVRSYHNTNNHRLLGDLTYNSPKELDLTHSFTKVASALNIISEHADVVVIPSNHDNHLSKWLNAPWDQSDYINAPIYFGLNGRKYYDMKYRPSEVSSDLEYALDLGGVYPCVRFLNEDESYIDAGIEHSQHGHRGPNGSQGSPNSFRNIGSRVNIGHSHSAGIIDGVYSAGCMCSLNMGYNSGCTSWSHSFIVTYRNGKRSIISVRNEVDWR